METVVMKDQYLNRRHSEKLGIAVIGMRYVIAYTCSVNFAFCGRQELSGTDQ